MQCHMPWGDRGCSHGDMVLHARAGAKDPDSEQPSPQCPFFQNPGTCRESEAGFTHLDFVPVVSVLLQHSGRVQRGLRHHRGLLEGAHARGLEPVGTRWQAHHWLPPPLLPGSDGETEAQGAEGAWRGAAAR